MTTTIDPAADGESMRQENDAQGSSQDTLEFRDPGGGLDVDVYTRWELYRDSIMCLWIQDPPNQGSSSPKVH